MEIQCDWWEQTGLKMPKEDNEEVGVSRWTLQVDQVQHPEDLGSF
jgi:hypothetical protein